MFATMLLVVHLFFAQTIYLPFVTNNPPPPPPTPVHARLQMFNDINGNGLLDGPEEIAPDELNSRGTIRIQQGRNTLIITIGHDAVALLDMDPGTYTLTSQWIAGSECYNGVKTITVHQTPSNPNFFLPTRLGGC